MIRHQAVTRGQWVNLLTITIHRDSTSFCKWLFLPVTWGSSSRLSLNKVWDWAEGSRVREQWLCGRHVGLISPRTGGLPWRLVSLHVVGVSLLVCLVTGLAVRARHGVTVSVSSVLCPTRRPVKESTKQILFYLQIIIVHIVAVKRDVQLRGERGEEEESLLWWMEQIDYWGMCSTSSNCHPDTGLNLQPASAVSKNL